MRISTHWVATIAIVISGYLGTAFAEAGPGGGPWGPWGTSGYGGFGPYDPYIRRGIPVQQGLSTVPGTVWEQPRGYTRITTIQTTRQSASLPVVGERLLNQDIVGERMCPRRLQRVSVSQVRTTSRGSIARVERRNWSWDRRMGRSSTVMINTVSTPRRFEREVIATRSGPSRYDIAPLPAVGERIVIRRQPVMERVIIRRQPVVERVIIQPEPVAERVIVRRVNYYEPRRISTVRVTRITRITRRTLEPVAERTVRVTRREYCPSYRSYRRVSSRPVITRTVVVSERPALQRITFVRSGLEPVGEYYFTRTQRVGPAFPSWENDYNNPYR